MDERSLLPYQVVVGNLQVNLYRHNSNWALEAKNIGNHLLKRVTIMLYPSAPVFVSKDQFRFGSIPVASTSAPQNFSLRVNRVVPPTPTHTQHRMPTPTPTTIPPEFRVNLFQTLSAHMNMSELRELCFYLHIEFEDIRGETKKDKAREIIQVCERTVRISELVETCQRINPHAPWPELPQKSSKPIHELTATQTNPPTQEYELEFDAVYLCSDSSKPERFRSMFHFSF